MILVFSKKNNVFIGEYFLLVYLMKSIFLSTFVFLISLFLSFSNCFANEIGEQLNDLSKESKSIDVKNNINDEGDKGDIPEASNEDIFGDEQAFPFIAGLGKNAAH